MVTSGMKVGIHLDSRGVLSAFEATCSPNTMTAVSVWTREVSCQYLRQCVVQIIWRPYPFGLERCPVSIWGNV